jgi:hypothetical protein
MSSTDRASGTEKVLGLTRQDLAEWLQGRRRFSTVRHPYSEHEFERKHLSSICASLGAGVLSAHHQEHSKIVPDLETARAFLSSLAENTRLSASVRISKAWIEDGENKENWETLLEQAQKSLESSTSKCGSPVTLITLVFRNSEHSGDKA